ncbi:MAG: D-2-hydroxyacid dehydrogenase [Kiritimatiellaeota bacterium]|nr:D-2-hydroxyacid dehydrogenase [Kiritimatiellota bacterium]
MDIVVLDGHPLDAGLSWDALKALGNVIVYDKTPRELITQRIGASSVVLTNKTPLGEAEFAALPALKYVGVLATGYNVVDTAAAARHGVTVTNIPTYGTLSVAQFVFALLLELCHDTRRHSDKVFAGEWRRRGCFSFWDAPLVELAGKTLGLVGFGRIGRQVAKIADAMGMRVIACDDIRENPPPYDGFQWADLDTLARESDVVSLHCPQTAANIGLVNAAFLAKMKPTAFLVNTARGGLVDARALADALNGNRLAGAALDVLAEEPPPADNPLLRAKNCVLTPHIAWATQEARARLMDIAVENLSSFLSGKPVNVVNP